MAPTKAPFSFDAKQHFAISSAADLVTRLGMLNTQSKELADQGALMTIPMQGYNTLRPLRIGDVMVLHGSTGSMKSGMSRYFELMFAIQVAKRNKATNGNYSVIVVHTEETGEAVISRSIPTSGVSTSLAYRGKVEPAAINLMHHRASAMPIYFIGRNNTKFSIEQGLPQRRMDLGSIRSTIEALRSGLGDYQPTEPALVVIDHLHDIVPTGGPSGDSNKDVALVEEDLASFRDTLPCPLLIISQDNSKQLHDGETISQPHAKDMRYAAKLWHMAAFIFSVWKPGDGAMVPQLSIPIATGNGTHQRLERYTPAQNHVIIRADKVRDSGLPKGNVVFDVNHGGIFNNVRELGYMDLAPKQGI